MSVMQVGKFGKFFLRQPSLFAQIPQNLTKLFDNHIISFMKQYSNFWLPYTTYNCMCFLYIYTLINLNTITISGKTYDNYLKIKSMGYRWHNGRLLNDDEYSAEIEADIEGFAMVFGFLIPFVSLGILGYEIGEGIGTVVGLVVGGIIGYIFNSFLAQLVKLIFYIIIIGGIIGVIVFIIWAILTS